MDKHLCTRCGSDKLSYKGDPTKKQDYLQCDVCWTQYPRDLTSEEFISLGTEHATLLFNQYIEKEKHRQRQKRIEQALIEQEASYRQEREKAIRENPMPLPNKPTLRETLENITTMLADIQSQLNTLEFRLNRLTSPSSTSVVSTHSKNSTPDQNDYYFTIRKDGVLYPKTVYFSNQPMPPDNTEKISFSGGTSQEVAFDLNGKPILPRNTKKI